MSRLRHLWMRHLLAACSPQGRHSRLSIFIFHRVLPEPDLLFTGEVDVRRFETIISWLHDWFRVLPMHEAVDMLQHKNLPSRAACITFDDGYADNYTHALPILRRKAMHATFFVATGVLNGGRMWNDTIIEAIRTTTQETIDLSAIGLGVIAVRALDEKKMAIAKLIPRLKYLDSIARDEAAHAVAEVCDADLPDDLMLNNAQLRGLHSDGMGIGAHTVSHPILTGCSDSVALREIADSRDHLESILGQRIGLFAYPNGKLGADYTQRHVDMVAKLGFDAAVSTNTGASRYGDDVFQLRRFTPWDCERWRFGLRMVQNTIRRPTP